MLYSSYFVIILIICFLINFVQSEPIAKFQDKFGKQKVILILADGVRWDYLKQSNLTGFERLLNQGVKAEYVQPIFPSNSYPNWYAIVTGMYAESHGMVNNYIWDEKRKELFQMAPDPISAHAYWWNESEPIWVTAERNGIKTGVYWWDGCQVPIRNVRPTECVEYKDYGSWLNPKNDTITRLQTILDQFKRDELSFALVYYEAIDAIGHRFGPESRERLEGMKDLDDIIQNLMNDIEIRNLTQEVSIVIVSDHGCLEVKTKPVNLIQIDKVLDENDVEMMLDRGTMAALYPKPGKQDKILNDLLKAKVEGLHFYTREEMPLKYHYRYNDKIGPIVLFVDKGYFLLGFKTNKTIPNWDLMSIGYHGYDPYSVEEMRAFMYAFGPKLRHNFTGTPIMMTDHYNLVCTLLGMTPNANNGSWSRVKDMFTLEGGQSFQDSNSLESNNSASYFYAAQTTIWFTLLIICIKSCLMMM